MNVELIKEHEDGSATYAFDMTEEERIAVMQAGILAMLKAGIESTKEYQDQYEESRSGKPD